MRFVDSLKVLLLLLGVIQLCPAQVITDFPCVIAALGGYLLLDRELENVRRNEEADCNALLNTQPRDFCNLVNVDVANFNTCLQCLAATTAAACDVAGGDVCEFVNGVCGPSDNIGDIPAA